MSNQNESINKEKLRNIIMIDEGKSNLSIPFYFTRVTQNKIKLEILTA